MSDCLYPKDISTKKENKFSQLNFFFFVEYSCFRSSFHLKVLTHQLEEMIKFNTRYSVLFSVGTQ